MNTIHNSVELSQIVNQIDLIEGCPIMNEMELLSALTKCGVHSFTIDTLDRVLSDQEQQLSMQRWVQQQTALQHQVEHQMKTNRSEDRQGADQKAFGGGESGGPSGRLSIVLNKRRSTMMTHHHHHQQHKKSVFFHRTSVTSQQPPLPTDRKSGGTPAQTSRQHDDQLGTGRKISLLTGAGANPAILIPPPNLPPVKERFPMERAAFLSLLLQLRSMEDERARQIMSASALPPAPFCGGAGAARRGTVVSSTSSLQALRGRLEADRLELLNAVEPQLVAERATGSPRSKQQNNSGYDDDSSPATSASPTPSASDPNVMENILKILGPFSISKSALDDFFSSLSGRDNNPHSDRTGAFGSSTTATPQQTQRSKKVSLMQFATWLVQEESKAAVLNTSPQSEAAKRRWKQAIAGVMESIRGTVPVSGRQRLRSGFEDFLHRRGQLSPEERLDKALQQIQVNIEALRAAVPFELEFPFSKDTCDRRQRHGGASVDEMLDSLCRSGPESRVTSIGKVLKTLRKLRTSPMQVEPAAGSRRSREGSASRIAAGVGRSSSLSSSPAASPIKNDEHHQAEAEDVGIDPPPKPLAAFKHPHDEARSSRPASAAAPHPRLSHRESGKKMRQSEGDVSTPKQLPSMLHSPASERQSPNERRTGADGEVQTVHCIATDERDDDEDGHAIREAAREESTISDAVAVEPEKRQLNFWMSGAVARPQTARGARLLHRFGEGFDDAKVKEQSEDNKEIQEIRQAYQEAHAQPRPRSKSALSVRRPPVMVRIRM